jgi:hypothetical protein
MILKNHLEQHRKIQMVNMIFEKWKYCIKIINSKKMKQQLFHLTYHTYIVARVFDLENLQRLQKV